TGDMTDGRPGILAEQQHDPVAFGKPDREQEICELVRLSLNVAKTHVPDFAVRPFADEGDLGRVRRMAIANVGSDVVAGRNIPTERCIELLVRLHSFHRCYSSQTSTHSQQWRA